MTKSNGFKQFYKKENNFQIICIYTKRTLLAVLRLQYGVTSLLISFTSLFISVLK